jgi:hypothetical protein
LGKKILLHLKLQNVFISEIPQPGTSLERQPTVKSTGSRSGISVADDFTNARLNACTEYSLDVQPLNTSCLDGRPISLEEPTPKSAGHHDNDKYIFGTSRKSLFEASPKEVSPIPHGTRRLPSRRRGQTSALTDSPYKRHLENTSTSSANWTERVLVGQPQRRGLGMYQTLKKNVLKN